MRKASTTETLRSNAECFKAHNKKRVEQLRASLPPGKRDVLDLIPLLLHEDSAALPGNEIGCGPCGVSCYTPTTRVTELARKYFQAYQPQRQAKRRLSILFVALMGSAGTVAFTRESDLDFWVGVDTSKHDLSEIELLRDKFAAIEMWAQTTAGLEVHFFVADLERIRDNDYGELSKESCGTALGELLKDEFYRTGVFVEGRFPYYWLIPAGSTPRQYTSAIRHLTQAPDFEHEYYVDLGPVTSISQSEFFGAALWQLQKGLRSPFKTVLKMALLDKYASELPDPTPLCESYKKTILESPEGIFVDPYVFLMDSLRGYYTSIGPSENTRLAEQCFLVRNLMSTLQSRPEDARQIEETHRVAEKWDWKSEDLEELGQFSHWGSTRREAFQKTIVKYLLDTYKKIRTQTQKAGVSISDRDLTIVGKKLLAAFRQEPGKVPREFSIWPSRDIVSIAIVEDLSPRSRTRWRLELKSRGPNQTPSPVMRSIPHPLVACAWCCANGMYRKGVAVIMKGNVPTPLKEFPSTVQHLCEFLPAYDTDTLEADALLAPPRITHLYVIPNWEFPDEADELATLFVFVANSLGEIFYYDKSGPVCHHWLLKEVLLNKIGRRHWSGLKWAVHTTRGQMNSTRRLSNKLEEDIREFLTVASF